MKLKYYLRGLGIGMLVTAIIFITVIIPKKKNMSDDEIKEAAVKLGMMEKEQPESDNRDKLGSPTPYPDKAADTPQTNNDPTSETTSVPVPAATEEPAPPEGTKTADETVHSVTEEPSETGKTTPSATPTSTPTPTPLPTEPAATKAPDPTKGAVNEDENGTKTVEIEVYRKMTSEQLSATLYENGLVDDAASFNSYLMTNRYASAIKMGTYSVEFGLTYKELAKLFTSR